MNPSFGIRNQGVDGPIDLKKFTELKTTLTIVVEDKAGKSGVGGPVYKKLTLNPNAVDSEKRAQAELLLSFFNPNSQVSIIGFKIGDDDRKVRFRETFMKRPIDSSDVEPPRKIQVIDMNAALARHGQITDAEFSIDDPLKSKNAQKVMDSQNPLGSLLNLAEELIIEESDILQDHEFDELFENIIHEHHFDEPHVKKKNEEKKVEDATTTGEKESAYAKKTHIILVKRVNDIFHSFFTKLNSVVANAVQEQKEFIKNQQKKEEAYIEKQAIIRHKDLTKEAQNEQKKYTEIGNAQEAQSEYNQNIQQGQNPPAASKNKLPGAQG